MELFHKAKAVRLRSHHDKYLLADDDEESVFQDRHGSAQNARWTVEFVEGSHVIRLKSCYDRYLTASNVPFLLGMTGRKVLQTAPKRLDSSVEWEPIRDGFLVKLKTRYGNYLRANGGFPPWRNSVTHDIPHRSSTQDWVLWEVEVLQIQVDSPSPSPVLAAVDSPFSEGSSTAFVTSPRLSRQESSDSFTMTSPPKPEGRTIFFSIAKNNGSVDDSAEDFSFTFKGNNVFELTQKLEDETGLSDIIVCSRNPLNGKLYPLKLQLPPNNATMHVVVVLPTSKGQFQLFNTRVGFCLLPNLTIIGISASHLMRQRVLQSRKMGFRQLKNNTHVWLDCQLAVQPVARWTLSHKSVHPGDAHFAGVKNRSSSPAMAASSLPLSCRHAAPNAELGTARESMKQMKCAVRLGGGGGGGGSLCSFSQLSFLRLLQSSAARLPFSQTVVPIRGRKEKFHGRISASVADVSLEKSVQVANLPKGDMWFVHKFGGTCVGTSKRIQNVADIILNDSSEKKLVVVSAMSKVTDMMYNLISKAQSRDDSYVAALDDVCQKHKLTAADLLHGDDLDIFLSKLNSDISNLRAMLRAIYIAGHVTESFSDFIVGHGELWSAHILSSVVKKVCDFENDFQTVSVGFSFVFLYFKQHGVNCKWMDTRNVLIVNPTGSNQVDPDYSESEKRLEKWFSSNSADVIIATGFIAGTPQNIPTTLKRDGSDFSAAIMGALFRARQITIWTDVDGVFSADPRKVSEAVILKTLSYQEAWEMSYFGANVLHPRTIIPVMKYDIPIVIRNIFNLSASGTMICQLSSNESGCGQSLESVVKGFATIDNVALVNVEGTGMAGVPGTASAIFGAVKDVGANASSEHSVCFAVPEKEVNAVAKALESRFRQALDAGRLSQVEVIPNCCILATVGQKMASTPGVSATLFNALAKANINVRAIAQGCSEYNITVVLKREDCIKGLRAIHSRFYLSKTTMAMGIIGPGLIGGTLLDQLRDQAAVLKEDFNIDLRVMGIIGSRKMTLSNSGIDLSTWRELQKEKAEVADLEKFVQHVHGNHFIPNTVLVDCTADSGVANHYYDWLCKGIHVITPNKKANSGPLDRVIDIFANHITVFLVGNNHISSPAVLVPYLKLRALQRRSYTHYFYEATVGAGLPIISTLRGLLETGDKILRIEGIFRAFSEVVAEAKQAGYTEPDPRDDLSGTDVGRKVIILARECGLKLELSDIPVESLVPEPLRVISSAEEFMQQLPQFDKDMEKRRQDAEATGECAPQYSPIASEGCTASLM
ncbi:Bifunctional aspartokinase/homoserine dehydrogenase 1, chloroplastic [Asimina triloba]